MLLRHATAPGFADPIDVRIDAERIAEVAAAGSLVARPGETTIDLTGHVLLPAFAEPHAHLDKALTADLVPNPRGDLAGAIEAWIAHLPELTVSGIADRAERALRLGLANGATAVRSHVNVGADVGLKAVEGVLEARRRLAGLVEVQLVALVGLGPDDHAYLDDALAMGVDVVGACPHLEPDPVGCIHWALERAAAHGLPVDLHMDETLAPERFWLPDLARAVIASGFPHPVAASHCVSLGVQDVATQRRTAELVAEAGVAVITLPQTNLFLQGRDQPVATPRGLTALRPLLAAGATVAAGADNLQDPFNTVGRADPLETGALLVMAGHLLPQEALDLVSHGARAAMGLEPLALAPGAPAELVALEAGTAREALALAPSPRTVIHRGRVVSGAAGGETQGSQN